MTTDVKDREYYKNKFDKLMSKNNYIPQMGLDGKVEEFIQCKDKYRPYYFISNMGYVISLKNEKNPWHILKTEVNWCGSHRKRPQFRCTLMLSSGGSDRISLPELVIEHFTPEAWELYNQHRGDYVIHHKISVHAYDAENNPQKINRLDNLQVVKVEPHKASYKFTSGQKHLGDKFAEAENKPSDAEIILPGDLTSLVKQMLHNMTEPQDILMVLPDEDNPNGFNTVILGTTEDLNFK